MHLSRALPFPHATAPVWMKRVIRLEPSHPLREPSAVSSSPCVVPSSRTAADSACRSLECPSLRLPGGDLHGTTIEYGRLLAENLEAVACTLHHKDPVLIIH